MKNNEAKKIYKNGADFLSENRGLEATRSEIECVNSSSERVANTHDFSRKVKPQMKGQMMNEFKLARIVTCGVGLGFKQNFEAFKKAGASKHFKNECFVCEKKDGFLLLSKDYKFKLLVPKFKVLNIEILADDLKNIKSQSAINKAEFLSERVANTHDFSHSTSCEAKKVKPMMTRKAV